MSFIDIEELDKNPELGNEIMGAQQWREEEVPIWVAYEVVNGTVSIKAEDALRRAELPINKLLVRIAMRVIRERTFDRHGLEQFGAQREDSSVDASGPSAVAYLRSLGKISMFYKFVYDSESEEVALFCMENGLSWERMHSSLSTMLRPEIAIRTMKMSTLIELLHGLNQYIEEYSTSEKIQALLWAEFEVRCRNTKYEFPDIIRGLGYKYREGRLSERIAAVVGLGIDTCQPWWMNETKEELYAKIEKNFGLLQALNPGEDVLIEVLPHCVKIEGNQYDRDIDDRHLAEKIWLLRAPKVEFTIDNEVTQWVRTMSPVAPYVKELEPHDNDRFFYVKLEETNDDLVVMTKDSLAYVAYDKREHFNPYYRENRGKQLTLSDFARKRTPDEKKMFERLVDWKYWSPILAKQHEEKIQKYHDKKKIVYAKRDEDEARELAKENEEKRGVTFALLPTTKESVNELQLAMSSIGVVPDISSIIVELYEWHYISGCVNKKGPKIKHGGEGKVKIDIAVPFLSYSIMLKKRAGWERAARKTKAQNVYISFPTPDKGIVAWASFGYPMVKYGDDAIVMDKIIGHEQDPIIATAFPKGLSWKDHTVYLLRNEQVKRQKQPLWLIAWIGQKLFVDLISGEAYLYEAQGSYWSVSWNKKRRKFSVQYGRQTIWEQQWSQEETWDSFINRPA